MNRHDSTGPRAESMDPLDDPLEQKRAETYQSGSAWFHDNWGRLVWNWSRINWWRRIVPAYLVIILVSTAWVARWISGLDSADHGDELQRWADRAQIYQLFLSILAVVPVAWAVFRYRRFLEDERKATRYRAWQAITDAHGKPGNCGRMDALQDLKRDSLAGVNVSGAYLAWIDLARAELPGADFSRADLTGASIMHADLRGADFSRADLTGANIMYADLPGADFRGARLRGARLQGAVMSGARFDEHSDLSGARFDGANLEGAFLERVVVDARHCQTALGATLPDNPQTQHLDLEGANLRGAHLGGACMTGVNLKDADLTNTELQGADLRYARLMRAFLKNALMEGANLSHADLREARLEKAYLKAATLCFASLEQAKLSGARFDEADLRGANLARAVLHGASFKGADLTDVRFDGASFIGADFTGAVGLTIKQIQTATCWNEATLPAALDVHKPVAVEDFPTSDASTDSSSVS